MFFKGFLAALLSDMESQHYSNSISVNQSKHAIFYFFGRKSPASVFKVSAAGYYDLENDCTENKSWVTDKGFKTKW